MAETKKKVAKVEKTDITKAVVATTSKADMQEIIDAYKEQNPDGYKAKKAELDAKLKACK